MFNKTGTIDDFFFDLFNDVVFAAKKKTPEAINLELELAGVKKEEIKVEAKDGYLAIMVDSPRKKGTRGISLSDQHDIDRAEIKYDNGLLTIKIPIKKLDMPKGKQLMIT